MGCTRWGVQTDPRAVIMTKLGVNKPIGIQFPCWYIPQEPIFKEEASYSSVVKHLLMVRLVIGLIIHDGPNEQFLVPASTP